MAENLNLNARTINLALTLLLEVNEWDLYVVENQSLVFKAALT
jgi:hypothetical protein